MAQLAIFGLDTIFGDVAVAADAAGDQYREDGLTRLWVQNNHSTATLVVTIKEQIACAHAHHGLIDMLFSIGSGTTFAFPPQDVSWALDYQRLVHIEYSFVQQTGQDVVFVAAIRG